MASIVVQDLCIDFPVYGGGSRSIKKRLLRIGTGDRIARDAKQRVTVQALRGITLSLDHGDRLGLIGANGAGKSTLLRTLAGIYEPSRGRIVVEGAVSPLFNPRLGMYQEATGHENIVLRGLSSGLSLSEIEERRESIAEFTELGDYLDLPLYTYSSGMVMRLVFAVATAVSPDILLMDEWISVGDRHFMEKARGRMDALVERAGILVLASHVTPLIQQICQKSIWLDAGEIKAFGPTKEILKLYEAEG